MFIEKTLISEWVSFLMSTGIVTTLHFQKLTEKAPGYVYIQLMSKYDKKFQKSPTHTTNHP